jgi:hypothetical protein
MRNLLTGKSGDRTQTLAGWEMREEERKEGDTWVDQWGKEWTIRNGIRQTVTKSDHLKSLAILPLSCPKCGKLMKVNDLNKKMWAIHSECFDCVVKEETRLKTEGKWEEYESAQIKGNIKTSLADFEAAIDTWMSDRDTFVTENGDKETWVGGNKQKIYEEIKENLKRIKEENA